MRPGLLHRIPIAEDIRWRILGGDKGVRSSDSAASLGDWLQFEREQQTSYQIFLLNDTN